MIARWSDCRALVRRALRPTVVLQLFRGPGAREPMWPGPVGGSVVGRFRALARWAPRPTVVLQLFSGACRFRKFCGSDSRNSAVRSLVRIDVIVGHRAVVGQVLGAHGRTVHPEEPAAVEDAVDDGVGEVLVVQHRAPSLRVLVGREEHRALLDVPLVDDVEEHIGGIVAVGEVADLVDHEDVRLDVAGERAAQEAIATGAGEVVDELRAVREERVEAVLHRAVRDGDRQVGLAASRLAVEDRRVPLGDEVGREQRPDRRQPQGRLVREVELVDRPQERQPGPANRAMETGASTVGDLLGEEGLEQVLVGPLLGLGLANEVAPDAPRVGEREPLQERIEVRAHRRAPFRTARVEPLDALPRVWPRGGDARSASSASSTWAPSRSSASRTAVIVSVFSSTT